MPGRGSGGEEYRNAEAQSTQRKRGPAERRRDSGLRDEGEFDAFACGVDAFGAHADFIAVAPFKLAGLCAATGSRTGCTAAANETRTRGGAATAGT